MFGVGVRWIHSEKLRGVYLPLVFIVTGCAQSSTPYGIKDRRLLFSGRLGGLSESVRQGVGLVQLVGFANCSAFWRSCQGGLSSGRAGRAVSFPLAGILPRPPMAAGVAPRPRGRRRAAHTGRAPARLTRSLPVRGACPFLLSSVRGCRRPWKPLQSRGGLAAAGQNGSKCPMLSSRPYMLTGFVRKFAPHRFY